MDCNWWKDDQEKWGNASLEELVRRFFEILESREVSSNGISFAPVQISSVRVRRTSELKVILPRMKELANEK